MISYLDTSIAVKLYVIEQGTLEPRATAAASTVVATSRFAYAEAMAAFARKLREHEFTAKAYQQVCREHIGNISCLVLSHSCGPGSMPSVSSSADKMRYAN